MATSTYGLIQTDPKKKFALQTASVDDQAPEGSQSQLPTANFSTLPTIQAPTISQAVTPQAANVPANFQFTGRYDALNRGLGQQESDAALSRRNALASLDEQYRNATQRSGDMAAIARTQLQENLAGRGLMMSGINAQAVGQQEKTYNDYLADLSSNRARAMAGLENDYAGILNNIFRQREGLFFDQQQEEEQRRLQEEQLKAEATAKQQQAEQQAQMIAAMQAQAEAARQAAAAAAAAASRPQYSAPSFGGGGGGYGGAPPAAQPVQPPSNNIALPAFAPGVTRQGVESWVRNNIDRNASPAAVSQVIDYLSRAGPAGLPLQDIAWLIQQYPNQATSGGDKQYAAGGGRRF